MAKYHVTYFYHATGMDEPDERDFGEFEAESKDGAMRQCLHNNFLNDRKNWGWIQGCLIAKKVA